MYPPQAGVKDPSFQVKNTFLEFSIPEDNDASSTRRRARSDQVDIKHSPLVLASKSPTCSPLLQPVDETMQAVPIDEVNFELLEEAADVGDGTVPVRRYSDSGEPVAQAAAGLGRDEPAYVVPTTPSPFLHSAFPPSVVPPFGTFGYGIPDMGLPPAFGEGDPSAGDCAYGDMDGQFLQDVDGNFMQGMPFLPEMYDPSFGQYMGYGWNTLQVEGADSFAQGDVQDGMAAAAAATGPSETFTSSSPQEQAVANSTAENRIDTQERERPKEGRRGKGRGREGREEEKAERRSAGAGGGGGPTARAEAEGKAGAGSGEAAGGQMAESKDSGHETPSVYTTVMLRNIPNKYTREMLIKQLSVDFNGLFDFMYLPIDFKNKCNVGYGFINFRTTEACAKFVKDFHGVDVRKCLPGLNSKKVVEVTPARVQGLQENVRRLRNSPVMNQLIDHPEWMPLLFNDSGEEEPFPNPEQPLPPVKPRGRNREAHRDV